MIYSKWTTFPYLLAVLLLLVPPTVKQAQAAPIAMSQTVVNCAGTIDGSNDLAPGLSSATCSTINLDGTLGQDADASTTGWLSVPVVPGDPIHVGKAEVSGVITGSIGGSMSASAQLLFYFDLVKIGVTPPPAGTVTINIDASGAGSAPGGQFLSQVRIDWGENEAFTNSLNTHTTNSGSPFSVTHTIDFIDDSSTGHNEALDWDALIWLTASCDAGNGLTCNAFVDPIFSFANPDHANFFAFNFSPNMPMIPVPAAVWLFGSGLIGLICVARRKAD